MKQASLLLLLTMLRGAAAYTTEYFFMALPGCRCNVNKPVNSVRYLDDSMIRSRLQRWDPKVSNVHIMQWLSKTRNENFSMNVSAGKNFTCFNRVSFGRDVSYNIAVTMPIFLRPFVSDQTISQYKRMVVVNCDAYEGFLFEESCLISDLPLISTISLGVKTKLDKDTVPIASVTINHQDLPWYMSLLKGQLHGEIMDKARALWIATVSDVCGCR